MKTKPAAEPDQPFNFPNHGIIAKKYIKSEAHPRHGMA
jgi:hypothetical protein